MGNVLNHWSDGRVAQIAERLSWTGPAGRDRVRRVLHEAEAIPADLYQGEPTYEQLANDADSVAIQRDDLRERLDRLRAAAQSDPDLPDALRDFLLRETTPGWLHVTAEMVGRLRSTGSHHAMPVPSSEGR